jgi:homoserine O-acetyltransferase
MDDETGVPRFSVESYLEHQGAKLVARFDANCYVRLTQKMDMHDVSRGRGEYADVLARIAQPTLVIGIDTDVLYPLAEQRELAAGIPHARLVVLEAPHGHDSFLIDVDAVNDIVIAWRQEVLER